MPHSTMPRQKITVIVLLLGFLLPHSLSTTPHHLNAIHGGGQSISREAAVGRKSAGSGFPIPEEQQHNHLTPSRVFRALSRRSAGRYVLATSSLVSECARVYAPAPLGLVASSLYSRLGFGLGSQGHGYRASLGQKKSSAFSYDRFMSQDPTADDGDLSNGGRDSFTAAIPPNKYGRVSSAFLARHDMGDSSTSSCPDKVGRESGEEKSHPVSPPAEFLEMRSDGKEEGIMEATPRQAKVGSVLNSLAALGRDRTNGAGDDLDLLSDSWEAGDGLEDRLSGNRREVSSPRTGESAAVADFGAPLESTIGRNLVDGDEYSSTLVGKLRLGEKTDHRSRRKPRRSRSSDKNAK